MHQTEQKRYSKTTALVLCGIFAALMAICSFITIPLGFTPVPINLATLGVFLTGGILGKKYGSISLDLEFSPGRLEAISSAILPPHF